MSRTAPRTLPLPSGEPVPVLGQGTWGWAEDPRRRSDELAALRLGLDLGMTLVDTAEMYADGAAEELVAEGIAGRRDEVFLVDKVLPSNATRSGTVKACRRSLDRLRTDRIDLYLLHWRGRTPLADTVEAFEELVQGGQIRYWGSATSTSTISPTSPRRRQPLEVLRPCRRHPGPSVGARWRGVRRLQPHRAEPEAFSAARPTSSP